MIETPVLLLELRHLSEVDCDSLLRRHALGTSVSSALRLSILYREVRLKVTEIDGVEDGLRFHSFWVSKARRGCNLMGLAIGLTEQFKHGDVKESGLSRHRSIVLARCFFPNCAQQVENIGEEGKYCRAQECRCDFDCDDYKQRSTGGAIVAVSVIRQVNDNHARDKPNGPKHFQNDGRSLRSEVAFLVSNRLAFRHVLTVVRHQKRSSESTRHACNHALVSYKWHRTSSEVQPFIRKRFSTF